MGRQGSDSIMVSSSIALLQERFRQLQRVKERREEKELLKLFSEPERVSEEPSKPFPDQPEAVGPCRQPLNQDFLSLGPCSNQRIMRADSRTLKKNARSSSLWPAEPNFVNTSNSLDSSDVDTSLHL